MQMMTLAVLLIERGYAEDNRDNAYENADGHDGYGDDGDADDCDEMIMTFTLMAVMVWMWTAIVCMMWMSRKVQGSTTMLTTATCS